MTEKSIINELAAASPNRRSFMQKIGVAGAVIGAAASRGQAQSTPPPGDINILNFALNLEYLEAEFYTVATTGQTISQAGLTVSGSGTPGPTTGGGQVTFTDTMVQAVAAELATDEQKHVGLLQAAITSLGGTPIAKPAINLNALGVGFSSMASFLALARAFEDIGVTAYGGAVPLIQNNTILGNAARILAVEAFHAGNIRAQIARLGVPTVPALDGADVLPPPSGIYYFAVDSSALSQIRTPGQVLYLAYGGVANAIAGGFFPAGVNGVLNTSSAIPAATDGASLTATPNPIHVPAGVIYGQTTISWNAPTAQIIQVRVGSPTGTLFTNNFNTGSMMTGVWVTNGLVLYLQDVTGGKPLIAANTLATLQLSVVTP